MITDHDFLAHLSRRLKWAIVIAHLTRPSSVVRPASVRRKLSHFRLLLWNRWTEFNETWQEARSQRPLPSLGFSGRSKKQDGHLASDWLRYFPLLLWNCWMEFNETWQEARSQCPLPSLCFSGRSEKQNGRPGLWLAETFSTSPLKPLSRIQQNLIGGKISKPSTKFVFFGLIGKTRWPPPSSDWLRHFRLLLWNHWTETWQEASSQCLLPRLCFSGKSGKNKMASDKLRHFRLLLWNCERNSTKLDRKQNSNALYQVCVFQVDRKNKMAALAYDWLRHFWLLLWNH